MNRSKGVTLLEILIACFIVAMAFIPILSTIQYGNKSTVKINNYSVVAKLAQGLVEECKHIPFRLYSADYAQLGKDEWFDVNQQYYPKTKEAIEELGKTLKSLEWTAKLKVIKSGDIIREVWINITATWKEGDGTTSEKPRELRLGNAIRNPDAD